MAFRLAASTAVLTALVALNGCNDSEIPTAPAESGFQSGLNAARLGAFRTFGQGCAATTLDDEGHLHGVAVRRKGLPFALPAINVDPTTGLGDGRRRRVVVNVDGKKLTLDCWVPRNTTGEALGALVAAAATKEQWKGMQAGVAETQLIPPADVRPQIDPEAQRFEMEMLEDSPYRPLNARPPAMDCPVENRAKVPVLDCGYDPYGSCNGWSVDVWFGGDTWSIEVQFYGCEADPSTGAGLTWLVGNGFVNWCSGGIWPDDRDKLIVEYRSNPAREYIPYCSDFRYHPESWGGTFQWPQIKSHGISYDYAIFQDVLDNALELINYAYSITITSSNSVYRSPSWQDAVSPGVPNGRHIYGDAADINSTESNWTTIEYWAGNTSPTPCAEPQPLSSWTHYHIDFRNNASLNQRPSCPTGWDLPRQAP